MTATISSIYSGKPTGTVTFYVNGTAVGTPQTVSNGSASINLTEPNGTYTITATYSGDSSYKTSTSASSTLVWAAPAISLSIAAQSNTVTAGQYALYSLNLTPDPYAGTVTFKCSGLPANASCIFNPTSTTTDASGAVKTVELTIKTQGVGLTSASGIAPAAGGSLWMKAAALLAMTMLIPVFFARRKLRAGNWIVLGLLLTGIAGLSGCSNKTTLPATPSGTSTVTVTATGTDGTTASVNLSLKIN